MRRYSKYDDDDRDYSVEDSVEEYDMREYANPHGYHNMDYDDKNFWQPENEYMERGYGEDNRFGITSERPRHLRPLGRRRRIYRDEDDSLMHDRRRERARLEDIYGGERYGRRNESDHYGSNRDGYYYRTDEQLHRDVRNRNDYGYEDEEDEGYGRRRTRWSEFYDDNRDRDRFVDEDDDARRRRHSRAERISREDDERGEFSDRKHPFGYYADLREDRYKRRRPYIRDSRY